MKHYHIFSPLISTLDTTLIYPCRLAISTVAIGVIRVSFPTTKTKQFSRFGSQNCDVISSGSNYLES